MQMHHSSGTKNRGRSQGAARPIGPKPTHPNLPLNLRTEATRPIGSGGTIHRGDRRDMNRQYNINNSSGHSFFAASSTPMNSSIDLSTPYLFGRCPCVDRPQ